MKSLLLPFLLLLPLLISADQPIYRMVSPKMKDGSAASPKSPGPILYDDKPVYKQEIDIKELKEQLHNTTPIETKEPSQNVSSVPSASFKEKMNSESGVKSTVEVILGKQTKISTFLDFLSDKPEITSYELSLFKKVKEYTDAASSESIEYSSDESIQKDLTSIKFKVAKIQKKLEEKTPPAPTPNPAPQNNNPPPTGLKPKNGTNSTQEEGKKGLLKPKKEEKQSEKKQSQNLSKKNASSNILVKHPKTKLNLAKIKLIKKAESPKVVMHKVEKKVSNKKKGKHFKKNLRDLLLKIDEEKEKLDLDHEGASRLYEGLKEVEVASHNVDFRTISLKIKQLRKSIKGINEDLSLGLSNCDKEIKKHNRKELKKLVQELLNKESGNLGKIQEKIDKDRVLSEKVKGLLKKKIITNESEIKIEISNIQKELSSE